MIQKLPFFVILFLFNTSLNAQTLCAFDELHLSRLAKDSLYKKQVDQMEQSIYQYTLSLKNQKISNRAKANYILPVVIHLIVPPGTKIGQGNNLTDLQVEQGLSYLNEAFSNSGAFQATNGVDVGIQFCLARRDPNGQPTNGITRNESNLVNEPMCSPGTDASSDGLIKQIVNWDCSQYINIWLVSDLFNANFGCGLAGYAYFPGAPCTVDGIVQESRYWNSIGGTGVTAHELGHYFSLNHTFNGGCTNGNCLFDGDRVCDTPPDNSASFAPCNTNSCNTDAPDLADDNTNYMDYSSCGPVHFTDGQRVRMIAALETTRKSLLQSIACVPPGDFDASALGLSVAKDLCQDTLCASLRFRNEGIKSFSFVFIDYSIDGIPQTGFLWNGLLNPNQSVSIPIPCIPMNPGKHQLDVRIGNPDNQSDFYLSNNSISLIFESYPELILTIDSITPTHCISDGTLTVHASGGTAPYIYSITKRAFSQTDPFFQLLLNGNYTVSVQDTNLCQSSLNLTIPDSCKSIANKRFITNRDARQLGNDCYLLTEELNYQTGSIWYEDKVNLNQSFDIYFDLNLGCIDRNGADGIAFVFQPISTSIGVSGGGLGYQGVSPSLAVEFDTWENGNNTDPFYDHMSIMRNGNVDHRLPDNLAGPVGIFPGNGNAEDCKFHKALIRWNAVKKTMDVYVDCNLRLSYTGDVVKSIFNGDPNVFFGFTAATGGSINVQQVCLNYITGINKLPDYTICEGESIQISGSPKFEKYLWSPIIGIDKVNIQNPIFNPDSTTKYYVQYKDFCGFDYRDSLTVFVKKLKLNYELRLLDSCGSFSGALLHILSGPADTGVLYSIDGSRFSEQTYFEIPYSGNYTIYSKIGNCIIPQIIEIGEFKHKLRDSILWIQGLNCKDSGRIVITGLDGIPPYQYRINGGIWNAEGTFNGLIPGQYTIDIKDQSPCVVSKTIQITNFINKISLQQDSFNLEINCCNPNAFMHVHASGSIPFYYYSLDNNSWTASGIFDSILPGNHLIIARDEFGCTSDSLFFTVMDHTANSIDTNYYTICKGEYVQIGTKQYSQAGVYQDYFKNNFCCDSLVITNLFVNPDYSFQNIQVICQGAEISVGTNKYNQSGQYLDTLQSIHSCDSIIYTQLRVNPVIETNLNSQICAGEELEVGIHRYNHSGSYHDSLQTVLGCDSIIHTQLVVHPVIEKNLNYKICSGEVIQIGIHRYQQSGIYHDSLQTIYGCDSILHTELLVNPTHFEQQQYLICKGKTVLVGGKNYKQTGVYIDSLSNQFGCDSIIRTQLFVDTVRSSLQIDSILCFDKKDGIIELNATSGIAPFLVALNDTSKYSNLNRFENLKPGSYILYIKDSLGCEESIQVILLQAQELMADLPIEIKITLGEKISLQPILNFIPTTIQWLPNTGLSCNNCLQPNVQTWKDIEYELIITNEKGCEIRVRVKILVDNQTDIYIPNVFSPNGDQINDQVTVFGGESIQEVSVFRLFDRWGNKVFENQHFQVNDLAAGWNGTMHGQRMNPAVFVYYAKAIRLDGTEVIKIGDVTLVK
ncbi:MAG: gliding motility-associated C-terminal domain-containing protein [Saprospiraceae bacterium]|nr:gliding motility-associated C-terminal domain-containing protein [Saprospiraceae bacterium]